MKHKMIIDYADELEWGRKIILPEHQKKCFATFIVDRKYLPLIKQQLISTGDDENPKGDLSYRKRTGLIDLDLIPGIVGSSDLMDKWIGKDVIAPVVDLRSLDISTLIKPSSEAIISMQDLNAVTSGDFDIGTAGDYLTFVAADADTNNLTGNISYTQISDITETAEAYFSVTGGSNTVTFDSDSPHGGDPTSGHLLSIGHNQQGLRINISSATTEVKNLRGKRTVAGSNTLKAIFSGGGNTTNDDFHDLIADGNSLQGQGISQSVVGTLTKVRNFIIYNCGNKGMYIYSNNHVENGLVYNCDYGLDMRGQAWTAENVSCFDNTTADFTGHSAATGKNNASSDASATNANWATGTDNQPSLTSSTEMELAVDANMADPKSGGTVKSSGKAPTYSTVDMNGVTYASGYPTGPKMLVSAATGTIIPNVMNYMRRRKAA
jgi:hypothetical protein